MASSLKAFAPLLAWRLGTTPAALYERQRALVRAGILEQSEGRGPGSGVQLGPYPVALLLVAVLATDSLSETIDKVRTFATAKSIAPDGLCPLTRKPTFVEALALLLDYAHGHWRKMINVTVHRTRATAAIEYKDKSGSTGSVFGAQVEIDARIPAPTKLVVNAMLTRDLIIDIAMDLTKMAQADQHARSAALQRTAGSQQRMRPRHRTTRRLKERTKL
jgi:hypothetical protein